MIFDCVIFLIVGCSSDDNLKKSVPIGSTKSDPLLTDSTNYEGLKTPAIELMKNKKIPDEMIDLFSADFDSAYNFLLPLKINSAFSLIQLFEFIVVSIPENAYAGVVTTSPIVAFIVPALCRLISSIPGHLSADRALIEPESYKREISAAVNLFEDSFPLGIVSLTWGWNINLLINFCRTYPTTESPISETCPKDVYDATMGVIVMMAHMKSEHTATMLSDVFDFIARVLQSVRPISDYGFQPKFSTECLEAMNARSRIIYEKTIDIARGILSQDATTYLQSAKIATDRFLALPDDEKKVLSCDPTAF